MIQNMFSVHVGIIVLVNRAEERLEELWNQREVRFLSSMVFWSNFYSDSGLSAPLLREHL